MSNSPIQSFPYLSNTNTNTQSNTFKTNISHFVNKSLKSDKDLLNIFHVNIRSLKNKFDDIKQMLFNVKNTHYHIIILSETWLKKDEIMFFEIDGYTMYTSVRSRIGGGLSVYIHNTIQSDIIYEFNDNNNHFLIIQLYKLNLKIVAIYNTHTTTFLPKLEDILSNNNNCIVIGDMNIDLLKKTIQYSRITLKLLKHMAL